jgi:hypothetical protein
MLFLSGAVYNAPRRLLKDGERGKLGEDETLWRMPEFLPRR